MENLSEVTRLINENPDYVCVPRQKFSLKNVVERYPDGMPSRAAAAKALMMTELEFGVLVNDAVAKLRKFF